MTNKADLEQPGTPKHPHLAWIIPCLLFIGVLLTWLLMGDHASKQEDRGTYGDMFGAVNSLFSGLAFAGIVYTILLQRQELRLQRDEMKKSVQAQQESANALDKQVRLAAIAAKINALSSLLTDEKHVLESFDSHINKLLKAHVPDISEVNKWQKMIQQQRGSIDKIKAELIELTSTLNIQNKDSLF